MSEPSSEEPQGLKIYLRLLSYVRPYWWTFLFSTLGFVLYAGTQPAFADLMKYLVNEIGEPGSQAYIWVPLAVLGIFVARGIGSFLGNYFISYVAQYVIYLLRMDMFTALLRLPSCFYHQNISGHLISKLTFNVEQVTSAASDALKVVIRDGATVIGLLIYLLYLNWKLTLIFLALSPLIAVVVAYASKRFRRLGSQIQDSMGDVTHAASESIQGYQLVRTFGGQTFEYDRFKEASKRNRRQRMKMVITQAISTPTVQFIVATSMAMLIFAALHPALGSTMDKGEFIAFITAAAMIAKPLRTLTEINSGIQRGIVAAQSIFVLLDETAEPDNGTHKTDRVQGHLTVRSLSFEYEENKPVLHELDIDIEPGQTIALVGRSGSGKSTLASLLPRFYEPTSGEILLDGVPLQDYTLESLREQIALVNQQVVLFAGTIRENIAYGSLADRSDEEILAAARSAHVMEFAERMPDGLDTVIGEKGVMLSGGQRQRLAIARAILKDAPILILDEATSALDTELERHIQAALDNVMEGRTTLVIAHRLSTIEKADRILVMDQGQVVEEGSHEELLAKDGAYAHLYRLQFREGSGESAQVGEG